MIRAYARIVGLVLVLVGLAHLSGLLGAAEEASSWGPGLYQLGLGSLFVCSGFLRGSASEVRLIVWGLGMLTLLGKGVMTLAFFLMGGEALLWGPIAVTGLVVGILSLLAARYLPDGTQQTGDPSNATSKPLGERKGNGGADGGEGTRDAASERP